MRNAFRVIILLGVTCFCFGVFVNIKPTLLRITIAGAAWFGLAGMLVATMVVGVRHWRKSSRLWMMPSLVCFGFLWTFKVTMPLAIAVNDWQFKRHLPDYEKVVDGVRNGTIPTNPTLTSVEVKSVNQSLPGVVDIKAARCEDGRFIAEFFKEGLRVRSGYLFKGYEDADSCLQANMRPESRYRLRHIVGRWYQFSD